MKQNSIIVVLATLFILFIISIFTHTIDGIDRYVFEVVNGLRGDTMDVFFLLFTTLLDISIIILICLFCMLLFPHQKKAIVFNLILSTLLVHVCKYIFLRPRPELNLLHEIGYSLPSAHACISIAFFGFIMYLIVRRLYKKPLKLCVISLFSLLIFLIGVSRIYFGVHYFSDVVVGYLLGGIYLICYIKVLKKYQWLN